VRIVIYCYRFAHALHVRGIPVAPKLVSYAMRFAFSCWIPAQARIGEGTELGYGGLGVVIHHDAVIGRDCLIGQGVTLGGGAGEGPGSSGTGVPRLGDRVSVGTGAKLLGGITVGDDATIGANAVVIRDVPPRARVGGVPARPLGGRDPDPELSP
jgi:serine O-acetyltransferase